MPQHLRSFLLIAALVVPISTLHAEGKDGGVDHFAPDQVRNFTHTEAFSGGHTATANIVAMQQHDKAVQQVFNVAFDDLRAVAASLYTTDPNSDIARINHRAANEPVKVSPTTIRLLQLAQKAHHMTGGAFDVVIAGRGTINDVHINKNAQTVQFSKPMQIDLASVTDGFLADQLMGSLWNANIDNAMVEVGGVTRSVGNDLVGPWHKTITDMAGRYAGRGMSISFSNTAAATVLGGHQAPAVGERNDKNPRAVAPALRSATVMAQDAAMAQALATAVYHMNPEEGVALGNRLQKVQVVVRDGEGTLHKSNGLE